MKIVIFKNENFATFSKNCVRYQQQYLCNFAPLELINNTVAEIVTQIKLNQ